MSKKDETLMFFVSNFQTSLNYIQISLPNLYNYLFRNKYNFLDYFAFLNSVTHHNNIYNYDTLCYRFVVNFFSAAKCLVIFKKLSFFI